MNPALIEAATPFLTVIGLATATWGISKGTITLSRGYGGGISQILGGLVMGTSLIFLPAWFPKFLALTDATLAGATGDDKNTDRTNLFSTDKPGTDPSECAPARSASCQPFAEDKPDTDNPLAGIPTETVLAVLGGIAALALTLGLITAIVMGVRHQRRKQTEALAAAAQARIEEQTRLDRVWSEAVARHDHLREEMMRHQSDIDLVLSMPLINDQNDPKTAAFTEALARAADLAHDTRPASATAVDAYATATRAADRAWGTTWRNADRIRLAQFGPDERATIKQVAKLMHRAENETSAEARSAYYRKAVSMLGDLIEIPRPAAEAIEQRIAGVLANPATNPDTQDTTLYYAAPTNLDQSILANLTRKARKVRTKVTQ